MRIALALAALIEAFWCAAVFVVFAGGVTRASWTPESTGSAWEAAVMLAVLMSTTALLTAAGLALLASTRLRLACRMAGPSALLIGIVNVGLAVVGLLVATQEAGTIAFFWLATAAVGVAIAVASIRDVACRV